MSCAVCLEEGVSLVDLPCGHSEVCHDCLAAHFQARLSLNDIPVECTSKECSKELPEQVVETLTDKDALARYERLVRLRKDPLLKLCPVCEFLCKMETREQDEIECLECSTVFCCRHGISHPGNSCAEFDRATMDDETSALLDSMENKPCPQCGIPTVKTAGCDHVKCAACGTKWCYRCESTEFHLSKRGLVAKCSRCGQEFLDHDHLWRVKLGCVLATPLWIPLGIAYSTLSLLASLPCAACCGCCADPGSRRRYSLCVFLPWIVCGGLFCDPVADWVMEAV